MEKLVQHGFTRARVDGELVNLEDDLKLDKRKNHTIEVVIDRLLVKPESSIGSPNRTKPRFARETGARSRSRWTRKMSGRESISSRRNSPVRCATTRSPNSSRGCSRSTARWARARAATAWARSASSTRSASSRFRNCRSQAAQSRAGTGATSSTSRCWAASPSTRTSTSRNRSSGSPIVRSRSSSTAAAKRRFRSPTCRTAASRRYASTRSRGSFPISSDAIGKPTR